MYKTESVLSEDSLCPKGSESIFRQTKCLFVFKKMQHKYTDWGANDTLLVGFILDTNLIKKVMDENIHDKPSKSRHHNDKPIKTWGLCWSCYMHSTATNGLFQCCIVEDSCGTQYTVASNITIDLLSYGKH